jgi:chromosome segregation ATPase
MKTIEQKIKNTNIKSIDLMYGTGTLDSLELEKSLSDSKVTLIKNLLEELDKMKPSVPQESYSSFLTVYNEAKADLNSYKSERKMFQNKIKNASRKQKNILVNLPKLENSLSKIIKKLVNCENPLLS